MERTFRTLVCTEEKGVCTLLLNAPPVNVITRALLEELDEAFQTLEFHTDLRAVVLSSALPKLFCAGADIKQFQTWTSATGSENCRFGSQVYRRIERFPRPVLCAVNAALELAQTIARRAPIAVAQIKKSVACAMEHGLEEGLRFENRGIALLCGTGDKQEGAQAFVEKRPPVFRNR